MRFFELFFPANERRQIAQLATEIARRSAPAAILALGEAIGRMRIPEARGYIRARARRLVEYEIDEVSAATPAIRNISRGPLVEETLERIIIWVIAESVKNSPRVVAARRAA